MLSRLAEVDTEVEFHRIFGGDHSYNINGENHMTEVLLESLDWALKH